MNHLKSSKMEHKVYPHIKPVLLVLVPYTRGCDFSWLHSHVEVRYSSLQLYEMTHQKMQELQQLSMSWIEVSQHTQLHSACLKQLLVHIYSLAQNPRV